MRELKTVFHHKVQWEQPNKPDIVQCYRCQRFGHTAKFCNYARRCVKCPEEHDIGCCKNTDRESPAYCCNCENYGHPANFQECPVRKKKVGEVAAARNIKNTAVVNNRAALIEASASRTRAGISFANVAERRNPQSESTGVNLVDMGNIIDRELESCKRDGGDVVSRKGRELLLISIMAKAKLDLL